MIGRRSARLLVAAAGVALVPSWLVAVGVPAAAAPCSSFHAIASADGVRTAAASPGFLLVEESDGGAPAAQAQLDSAGVSVAYAGYPYPGDAALSVLPLAGAPRDAFPLTVESSYPASPEAETNTGVLAIEARSAERTSTAKGRAGAGGEDGSSAGVTSASADASCGEDGTVVAAGESLAESLSFGGGVLRIGKIRSIAKVVVGPDGVPKLESAMEAGPITVAGQTVALTDKGLVVGESASPLPDNPLGKALLDAGIDVTYVAARKQQDGEGVTAPALRITLSRHAVGSGPTVMAYTFGRAFAAASVGGDGTATDALSEIGTEPALTAEAADDGGGGAALSPDGRAFADGVRRVAPEGGDDDGQVALGRTIPSGAVTGFSSWSVYVVMVVAAAALLSGALLLRSLAVRLRWT